MVTAVKKTISLPPDLARQVEEMAEAEGKTGRACRRLHARDHCLRSAIGAMLHTKLAPATNLPSAAVLAEFAATAGEVRGQKTFALLGCRNDRDWPNQLPKQWPGCRNVIGIERLPQAGNDLAIGIRGL
jgi:hypothetical protein